MRKGALQAEEVALAVAALLRRCAKEARLAGGGRRRGFGRTPTSKANLECAGIGRSRSTVCEELRRHERWSQNRPRSGHFHLGPTPTPGGATCTILFIETTRAILFIDDGHAPVAVWDPKQRGYDVTSCTTNLYYPSAPFIRAPRARQAAIRARGRARPYRPKPRVIIFHPLAPRVIATR